jgi:hypothetical protein
MTHRTAAYVSTQSGFAPVAGSMRFGQASQQMGFNQNLGVTKPS